MGRPEGPDRAQTPPADELSFWQTSYFRESLNGRSAKGTHRLDKHCPERVRLPESGENLALAVSTPRVAALCYDRIWSPDRPVPNGVRSYTDSLYEREHLLFQLAEPSWTQAPHPLTGSRPLT